MNDRQKAFTEAMVAAVFSGGFRGTVKAPLPMCVSGGRQQGKLFGREMVEALRNTPWHNQPQPPRTYTGHVSRLDGACDVDICSHPSNVFIGGKIIGRWFISRCEGGEYEFVTHAEWERLKPLVPIYGERIGDQMRMYDRILAEGGYGDGFRERTITDQELVSAGYRVEYRGKSIEEAPTAMRGRPT